MFPKQIKSEIVGVARSAGIEPAALLAVAQVESGGVTSSPVSGRDEPLIRFEGHYFYRLLPERKRSQALDAGLAAPKAGDVPNPRTQENRWKMLNRATMIDRAAAFCSTSWGVGQVMGDHWKWLGYASIDQLVEDVRSGVAGQMRLMVRFIARSGLTQALNNHDWAGFARAYNGPAYARNSYDRKIAEAYRRFARERCLTIVPPLKRGDTGTSVMQLQTLLTEAGFPVKCDGNFGIATQSALIAFQQSANISDDGILGCTTLKALENTDRFERKSRISYSDPIFWIDRLYHGVPLDRRSRLC
ncbi:MAG: DUF3380 domain-containing protein [Rhizobiaceae bacterium]|nr:DUF3380 domain-containing protein [Rhizobiaceae bacterium]